MNLTEGSFQGLFSGKKKIDCYVLLLLFFFYESKSNLAKNFKYYGFSKHLPPNFAPIVFRSQ